MRAFVVNLVSRIQVSIVLQTHFAVYVEACVRDGKLGYLVETIGRSLKPVLIPIVVIHNGDAAVRDHLVVHNLHVELFVDLNCVIVLKVLVVELVALG